MKKNLLKEMAREHGVTEREMRQEMELAIRTTFCNPNLTDEQRKIQDSIPRKGEIPTVEEFVDYIAREVKNNNI